MTRPTSNGSNPPCNHAKIQAMDPSKWCGKIPLIDNSQPNISGQGVVSGTAGNLGRQHWENMCDQIHTVLSKGIPAKKDWVLKAPATESHAIGSAARMFAATLTYITMINDIPNNPPDPTPIFRGEDDETAQGPLQPEEKPTEIPPDVLIQALNFMDYMAAPQEPILDEQPSQEQ